MRNRRFQRSGQSDRPVSDSDSEEELVLDPGNVDTSDPEDSDALQEEEERTQAEDGDEGQTVHNERVVKTIRDKAIEYMEHVKKITLKEDDIKIALQIFPRVSVSISNLSLIILSDYDLQIYRLPALLDVCMTVPLYMSGLINL